MGTEIKIIASGFLGALFNWGEMKSKLTALALFAIGCSQAPGALSVSLDLGVLDIGEYEFEGEILEGNPPFSDFAQLYGTATSTYSSGEFVVSFTIEQELQAALQSVLFTFGDPDAFLLNSVETSATDGGSIRADGWIASAFLDGALGTSEPLGVLQPGQYFISVEDFEGGPVTTARYSLNLTEVPTEPGETQATAISLGILGDEASVITLDTFGSATADTELAVYAVDGNGALSILQSDGAFVLNDDANDATLQSAVSFTAPEGNYVAVVGEWDTTHFTDSVIGGPVGGEITLNSAAGATTGTIGADGLLWYSFAVVPEPSSLSLIALGGLALLRRRRS